MSKDLDKDRSETIEADFEEVAASCGHFSFSLYDFGTEMQNFLTILEDLKEETERTRNRSWKWLRFWQKSNVRRDSRDDPERAPLLASNGRDDSSKDITQLIIERRNSKHWGAIVPDANPKEGFYRRILHILRVLERDDGESFFPFSISLLSCE